MEILTYLILPGYSSKRKKKIYLPCVNGVITVAIKAIQCSGGIVCYLSPLQPEARHCVFC